jgi:hypothetical protein
MYVVHVENESFPSSQIGMVNICPIESTESQIKNGKKDGLAGNRTPDHSHAKGVLYH